MARTAGANRWISASQWPVERAPARAYYLSGERANSSGGGGALVAQPAAGAFVDSFVYDPAVPTRQPRGTASNDMRETELRQDVLVYSTAPLSAPLSVVGDVKATLYVSADVPDTDLSVTLNDVYPDGTSYRLTNGMLRLRYRDGFDRPRLLEAGRVYEVQIDGMVTANQFGVGHRIRIDIAAANFPTHERNMNTGGDNSKQAVGRPARIQIHRGPRQPSRIDLPVYGGT